MSGSAKSVDVITVFAEDVPATRAFYEEVLELPVAFEEERHAVFKLGNAMLNLIDVADAPEMIAPAAVAPAQAGARSYLGYFVDDVDAACAELAGRGVTMLNGPVDRPWGVRTATFADPAGHLWTVAQDLD